MSADITRQSGNQAFRIQNTGRYLIIANTRINSADQGNNNRSVMRTSIKVGGTVLPSIYGMASGYGRDSGNADEDGAVVVSYIDHTVVGDSSDDITVHVQNFGDTTIALADEIADQSGIQIIRLPDDSDYLQVKNTTGLTFSGTMDYSLNDPTWTEFGWTTQDVETDSAVIEWASGNDVTLKSAGHYMVIYSVRADTSGTVRKGATYRLKLSDTEIPSSRVVSYMRGSDGAVESWVQWAGIVEASASDILNIDWAPAGESAGGTLTEAAMTVIKLPDTADYLRIRYDSSRAGETTGVYPFNQEDEDDAGVHDNSTNNSRISGDSSNHDWLLLSSWFLRNTLADSTRTTEHFRWYRTGTEINYGSGLSFTRGDQSTTGVPAGGRNAACVVDSLGTGEYVEVNMRLESGTASQSRDFIGNQVGITGVALDTLAAAPADPTFTLNSYRWYVDNDGANPTEVWGLVDLAEDEQITAIPPFNDPPSNTQELRLRTNITVNTNPLSATSQQFKLQFKTGTDGDCTTGSWTDVGAAATWEFASSSVTDGAVVTTALSSSEIAGQYAKSNPTTTNTNSATAGQEIEYDFHIIGNF